MKYIFIFLISFSFTFSESYLTKADFYLTSMLEGNNNNPFTDIAMEGLALATPFIEFGAAGFDQIANDKLIPSFSASLGVQLPIALGKYFFKRERPQRHYNPRLWNSRYYTVISFRTYCNNFSLGNVDCLDFSKNGTSDDWIHFFEWV